MMISCRFSCDFLCCCSSLSCVMDIIFLFLFLFVCCFCLGFVVVVVVVAFLLVCFSAMVGRSTFAVCCLKAEATRYITHHVCPCVQCFSRHVVPGETGTATGYSCRVARVTYLVAFVFSTLTDLSYITVKRGRGI